MRARSPRFKPGISHANVATCKAVLQQLGYHGPVALSWDDTALEPAISLYQESKNSACIILGSSRGPIEVASEVGEGQWIVSVHGTLTGCKDEVLRSRGGGGALGNWWSICCIIFG